MSIQSNLKKTRAIFFSLCISLALVLAPVCLAWAEETPEATEASDILDGQRDALRRAQQRLIELGHLSGGADGAYGPKTEAALRAYQAAVGLEETGHLDAATFDALTHVSAESATAKDVQQRLIDFGYLSGAADGVIGPRSISALKLFQRVNGLKASGKVDEDTLALLFSEGAVTLPARLSQGDSGEAVTKLQQRLAVFGFMSNESDGTYGQSTAAAVRAFQRHLIAQGYDEGIEANGVASPLTQYCLYSDRYSTYLNDVMPGQSDAEARRVETRLRDLGYFDAEPDDVLDDYALEALKLFQGRGQMQPDGLVDRETVDALFTDSAPLAERCAPHDIASGESGLAVQDVEAALVCGGVTLRHPTGKYDKALEASVEGLYKYLQALGDDRAELFADPKALSIEAQEALSDGLLSYRTDDTGNAAEVTRIQRRLHGLFYLDKAGVDGKFGRDSKNAVKAFQTQNGLESTGQIDEATQTRLFSQKAEPKQYDYRIEVSIDRQVVEVYQRNIWGEYKLVNSFTCSTGLHDSTPRGIFLDGKPISRWHHFQKFNCWAQYSYEIQNDILFHSVIYSSDNENSLRSGSLYALGNPASHGCVRLKVEDAKYLFENCKRGTAVIVIY